MLLGDAMEELEKMESKAKEVVAVSDEDQKEHMRQDISCIFLITRCHREALWRFMWVR